MRTLCGSVEVDWGRPSRSCALLGMLVFLWNVFSAESFGLYRPPVVSPQSLSRRSVRLGVSGGDDNSYEARMEQYKNQMKEHSRKKNGVAAWYEQTNGKQRQNTTTTTTGSSVVCSLDSLNGVLQPSNGQHVNDAPTAPEVNNWTSIMSKGIFHKNDENDVYKDLEDLSSYDLHQIEAYWDQQIMPAVNYLGTANVAKVYNALRVAYRAHRGQNRKSGEPFIIHPIAVALLLTELKMDAETVMAGLLHDTVEDTDLTFEQVEAMFGSVVRSIVEGETKVSKLPKLAFEDAYADEQAENLRQMFVAMTDDYRIIIVKLADRLHNMRTLRHMKPAKQVKISRETLDIFAPLAHRMGIWQFKSELEDTAFMYLYPLEYKRLNRRLRQHQTKYRVTLDKSQHILKKTLDADPTLREQAMDVKVCGRTKELYSLWHKMETKAEHNLDHIVDVVALRVIITPKELEESPETDRGVWLCYHVLGLVQHLPGFQPVPTRVKDYISFPKPNGYQSLHTALMWEGQTIEVQIRTNVMHQVAEYGMASHWAYTDGKRRSGSSKDDEELYITPWLSSIKEWQNDFISARDFVDSVRRELLGKRVFVFLRNGKILNLARGATAIDAAFQIHTEVGLRMHGVEINGKPVPFSYELQNGDVVSVLTGEGRPATDWMRYSKSRSTRSKLRSYFRTKQKESLREAGEILLMDYLGMHGSLIQKYSYLEKEFTVPSVVEEVEDFLPGKTHYNNLDDLLVDIGKKHERSLLHQVASRLFRVPQRLLVDAEEKRQSCLPLSVAEAVDRNRRKAKDATAALAAQRKNPFDLRDSAVTWPVSLENMALKKDKVLKSLNATMEYADPEHLCEHCLPIYGDEIVGTRPKNGDATTTVHRVGCPHAQRAINLLSVQLQDVSRIGRVDSVSLRYSAKQPQDIPVKLSWADFSPPGEHPTLFMAEVLVHAQDRKLLLADCSELVSELSEIVKTGSTSNDEHAILVFLVKVHGLSDLQNLMDSLRQVRSVMAVERRFGSELLK